MESARRHGEMNAAAPDCCAVPEAANSRAGKVVQALRLEYLTVIWNLVEGVVAVAAAIVAGSVALMGFGIDSFVECASAAVMIWRLGAERRSRLSHGQFEAVERRARRLVGASLFLLAAYVSVDAVQTLVARDRPEFSAVGVGLTGLSLLVMLWLA